MALMMEIPAARTERIRTLYRQAGELEFDLWNTAQSDPFAELTSTQARKFNDYVREAQELISEAVPGEASEAGEETLVSEAHRYLRAALVPALHKALLQP
jgi:hypothetical protein